jgi:hypothetical protein
MSVSIDGPTLLVSSSVAVAASTALVRATRTIAKRQKRPEDLPRMLVGLALVLLGLLLICIALRRMALQ